MDPVEMPSPGLWTVEQTAAYLQASVDEVWRLTRIGALAYVPWGRKGSGRRYTKAGCDAYITRSMRRAV